MTKTNLVTGPANTTLEQAKGTLQERKVEKLLLVNGKGELAGLITMRDIDRVQQYPRAARDKRGRLRVGAAVGVHDYERVEALIAADVDVIVVDTAHGHSQNVVDTVRKIKKRLPDRRHRRQYRHRRRRPRADRRRRRRGQGRHRSRRDLHHPHHLRRRRAADLRHHGLCRGGQ